MQEIKQISEVIELYFQGTYLGDSKMLNEAFHQHCRITGIIQKVHYDWSLDEFITRVTAKPTAQDKNEIFDKTITLVDVTDELAFVKAQVKVNDLIFTDYITLIKINGIWKIRNKAFIN